MSDATRDQAYEIMMTLNKTARDIMVKYRVHACTDVTGFGMLGHLLEMTQGSNVCARIRTDCVAVIEEAVEFARLGILPAGMYRNRSFAQEWVDEGSVALEIQDILYDPQTSGGLLMAVDREDARQLTDELKSQIPTAGMIGEIGIYKGGRRIFLL